MSRVTIWQCQDNCCAHKPHTDRWWAARSKDFEFYEWMPTYIGAVTMTNQYLKGRLK